MAIDPQTTDTVTIPQLDPLVLALETFLVGANADGQMGHFTAKQLAEFIAPYVSALGASPFVENTGSPLPNPIDKPTAITFVGAGTFDQTTGADIVTTEELNVLFWSSDDGITGTWTIGVEVPVDLANYYNKEEVDDLIFDASNLSSVQLIPEDRSSGITNGSPNTATTLYFGEKSIFLDDNHIFSKLSVYCDITGQFRVAFYTLSGTSFVRLANQLITVSSVGLKVLTASDFPGIDLTFPSNPLVYIAIAPITAGIFKYNSLGELNQGVSFLVSSASGTITSSNNFNLAYYMEATVTQSLKSIATESIQTTALAKETSENLDFISNMKSGTAYYPENRLSGLPNALPINSSLYFIENSVFVEPGRIFNKLHIFTSLTGTVRVGFFTLSGANFTRVGSQSITITATGNITLSAVNFPGIEIFLPLDQKVYIGLLAVTPNIITYNTEGSTGSGFSVPNTTSGLIGSSNNFHLSYYLEDVTYPVSPIVETLNDLKDNNETGVIEFTISEADKLVMIGDSYTESFYSLKQKSWINVLSNFTDWNIESYGLSSNQLPELIAKLRANTAIFETVPPQDYNGTYGLIASFTNDVADGIVNGTVFLETYMDNVRTMCRVVKSMGMIPVLCSEWIDILGYGELFSTSGRIIAEELGILFIDVQYLSKILQGNTLTGFFGGNHPGTRTNSLIWKTMLKEINAAIPSPKKSIKIFRKRSAVTVSTIADLFYKNISERNKKFLEIQVSESRIADDQQSYYDELDLWTALDSGRHTVKESEYLKLKRNIGLPMSDYSLIEVVLPMETNHITSFQLITNSTDATVYYKDVLNDVWVSIPNIAGTITIKDFDLSKFLDYDKAAFIFYKSGGFSLSDVRVKYSGNGEKNINRLKRSVPIELATTELLANQKVDTLTGWSVTGTLTPAVDTYGSLPSGITNYVDLTTSNYLKQTVTFAASTLKRKIQIKAWVRRFPEKHDHNNTFPGVNGITSDSYDFATLETSIYKNSKNCSFSKDAVSLYNQEILIEADLPPGGTSLVIGFRSLDLPIQFMWSSVKIS